MMASIEELQVGQSDSYERIVTEKDIEDFAKISGDNNPVHLDEDFAKTTIFNGRIAHGMLAASFISTTVGTKLPGYGAIYIS
ncbi:MAG: MaoC family dehydratase, partial [Pseudomonadota bacterium]|nr:MaoC family dehydratase [Pseudomonadota bacterium]